MDKRELNLRHVWRIRGLENQVVSVRSVVS